MIDFNAIAILTGKGDLIDGAAVLAALNNGVTRFVDGDEAEEVDGSEAKIGFDWE